MATDLTAAIPGYRILRLIERGGMGAVYLAEDETLRRLVAIKIIHPDFVDDADFKQRFTREALTVAAFQHPNIVTVHASGWQDGKQYIVMEYLSGGTLHEKLLAGPLTAPLALEISQQMADALAYAHEREVIHRDFKPRNILLRESGSPVLSDFGVAKSQATQASQTAVGLVVGNVRYMAPEQARGEQVSDRIDVYAWGLVLHELLTGDIPAVHPVRDKQQARQILRSAGRPCGELIARCLDSSPSARPSALECRDWLRTHAVSAPSRHRVRSRALVMAATGAALLAMTGYGLVRGLHVPTEQSRDRTVSVSRQPATARTFIDSVSTAADSVRLAPGPHEAAAVAAGYYGQLRHLDVKPGETPTALDFSLAPTRLPSADEQERFVKLADDSTRTVSDADVASVGEPTLQQVLKAKQLHITGDKAGYASLRSSVDELQRIGDARSAVATLLIDSVQSGHIGKSQITQQLQAASEAGDAMASLYIAEAYRGSIDASGNTVSAADPLYRTYCRYLALARSQGWAPVADEYWRRDRCTSFE